MIGWKAVALPLGRGTVFLSVPDSTAILKTPAIPALLDPDRAIHEALGNPIGAPPFRELLRRRRPSRVAITISDITRPVPNRDLLFPLLDVLAEEGLSTDQIVVIVGTGMHRPSSPEERLMLLGGELLGRVEVIDHRADHPESLVTIRENPLVRVCARFARADLRVVTGSIEPHFMAGFSGGRKGVCPALVDLATIQRFHGYETMDDSRAAAGVLEGNPCHTLALEIARAAGVDFLLNVALTMDRRVAGVYAGDLEKAHAAGCRDVARWSAAPASGSFHLVVTTGGGFPLDQTFYQTIKGMVGALPLLGPHTVLLVLSGCGEGFGSEAYRTLLLEYGRDWRRFLGDIAASSLTQLDQWEFQMQTRVLSRIGCEKLWLATDGLPRRDQRRIAVTPLEGEGDAAARAQRAIDALVADHPGMRIAVIPDGPYTLIPGD